MRRNIAHTRHDVSHAWQCVSQTWHSVVTHDTVSLTRGIVSLTRSTVLLTCATTVAHRRHCGAAVANGDMLLIHDIETHAQHDVVHTLIVALYGYVL